MPKKVLKCPHCGLDANIYRIESVICLAKVTANPGGGWEYGGGSEIDWNTQGRKHLPKKVPEFYCYLCEKEFNL